MGITLHMSPLLAAATAAVDPARGTPTQDLIPATIVGLVALVGLAVVARAHRAGRFRGVRALGGLASRHPALHGLPPWAALPIAVTTGSLLLAVFGFYWDVSTHIDNGRDPGPFANPAHWFILLGLAGIALAGFLSVLLADDEEHPGTVRLTRTWRAPIGGLMLLGCGVIALAGFPLDDVWHRIFGQDVTLWGPTHVQMVSGAALATISMWVLHVEGSRAVGTTRPSLGVELPMAGAFLIGLAALQAEFDFGAPQFRLVFQPILIALAAGMDRHRDRDPAREAAHALAERAEPAQELDAPLAVADDHVGRHAGRDHPRHGADDDLTPGAAAGRGRLGGIAVREGLGCDGEEGGECGEQDVPQIAHGVPHVHVTRNDVMV